MHQISGVLAAAERREVKVAQTGRHRRLREQVAGFEDLSAREIILQPVAHDEIRAEQHELLHAVGDAQPGDERGDHRRLAAAGHDVQQQSVRADLPLAENLVGRHDAQERLPLVRPERALTRKLVVVFRGQELDC
ncbi:MAG TPA: hypothetical protein VNO52_18915 [Methylomirabilota bacterium]|nr:hypothetical protein [Methylomirabilota bacterium]